MRPESAAWVRTFVVSWNDAALMKDSLWSEALVMPSRRGSARAGLPPDSMTFRFFLRNRNLSMTAPGRRSVSPGSSTRTYRSICEMMISWCLSSIVTFWLR